MVPVVPDKIFSVRLAKYFNCVLYLWGASRLYLGYHFFLIVYDSLGAFHCFPDDLWSNWLHKWTALNLFRHGWIVKNVRTILSWNPQSPWKQRGLCFLFLIKWTTVFKYGNTTKLQLKVLALNNSSCSLPVRQKILCSFSKIFELFPVFVGCLKALSWVPFFLIIYASLGAFHCFPNDLRSNWLHTVSEPLWIYSDKAEFSKMYEQWTKMKLSYGNLNKNKIEIFYAEKIIP